MAISFVGSAPAVTAINGGDVTITFSNLVDAAGAGATLLQNDIVVVLQAHSSTANVGLSTSSSGWTQREELLEGGATNNTNVALYHKLMSASPDTSIVLVGNANASHANSGIAFAFRGVDTTTPFDVADTTASGTATGAANPPAITPVTAGAWILVMAGAASGTGGVYSLPADLSATTNHFRTANRTETVDVDIGMGLKTNWSSGAFDPGVWTWAGTPGAGASWLAVCSVLRPASSAKSFPPFDPLATLRPLLVR